MLRVSKLAAILCLAFASSIATGGEAGAATTVGQTFSPAFASMPGVVNIQTATASQPSYAVPAAGVITSFSHISEASPDSTLQLVVVRPTGPDYLVVGVSTAKTLASAAMNTFPERIPVQAGDLLGVEGTGTALGAMAPAPGGNTVSATASLAFTGGMLLSSLMAPASPLVLDISAVVEPDADGDGYGDETQDLCPTDKTTQGTCNTAGPKLTLTAATTQKTKASFSFSAVSDEASSATVDGTLTYYVKTNGKKKKKTIKLAPVTQSLLAGVSSKFSFTLSSKAKSALKKSGKLKVALSIVSTDVKGNKSTNTLSLTIKRK